MLIYQPKQDFIADEHFDSVPLHQGISYRLWQERYGRKVISLVIEKNQKIHVFIQCIAIPVPYVGTIWIAPGGPLGTFPSLSICEDFYDTLAKLCLEHASDTFAIRIQHAPISRYVSTKAAESSGSIYLQPYHEQVLDINKPKNQIIKGFSESLQRTLKKMDSEENICTIHTTALTEHFSTFYGLLDETAKKKNFALHPVEYYQKLFEVLEKHNNLGFLVVCHDKEDNPLTAAVIVYTSMQAYFLFAGSSEKGIQSNAPLSAHLATVQEAQKHRKTTYNLGAVDAPYTHNLQALTVFKKKMGGKTLSQEHPRDIVLHHKRYRLFRILRLKHLKTIRKFLNKLAYEYIPKTIRFILE